MPVEFDLFDTGYNDVLAAPDYAQFSQRLTAQEVEACFPYLRRQIEVMRPKAILLLGAVALKYLVKGCGDAPRFSCATRGRKPSCGST